MRWVLTGVKGKSVEPERLPAIVQPVEQAKMMTVQMKRAWRFGGIAHGQDHIAAALDLKCRLGRRTERGGRLPWRLVAE